MDTQKLRQEFEKLPDIKGILYGSDFGFNESLNEYYHPDHTNHRLNYAFIMGAWMAWKAKAQAVPEPSIDLTGHDIKFITNFMCYSDLDNLDTEVTIQKCKSGFDGAGLYAWVSEYPEEGGIKLGEAQEQKGWILH